MTITLNDLDQKPCEDFWYLYKKYKMNEPFDPIVEIISVHGERHKDLRWLLGNCTKFRTQENLGLYIQWNPGDYEDLCCLLSQCPEFRTQKNFDLYLQWYNGDDDDLRWLLDSCPEFRTQE